MSIVRVISKSNRKYLEGEFQVLKFYGIYKTKFIYNITIDDIVKNIVDDLKNVDYDNLKLELEKILVNNSIVFRALKTDTSHRTLIDGDVPHGYYVIKELNYNIFIAKPFTRVEFEEVYNKDPIDFALLHANKQIRVERVEALTYILYIDNVRYIFCELPFNLIDVVKRLRRKAQRITYNATKWDREEEYYDSSLNDYYEYTTHIIDEVATIELKDKILYGHEIYEENTHKHEIIINITKP